MSRQARRRRLAVVVLLAVAFKAEGFCSSPPVVASRSSVRVASVTVSSAAQQGPASGSAVIDVTTETFDSVVLDPTKHAFVKFYAPWCGPCNRLAPAFEELGKVFEKEGNVVVAKVNAVDQKLLAKRYGITGYPKLKYFPAGRGGEVEAYTDARDLDTLVRFISNKVSSSKPVAPPPTISVPSLPSRPVVSAPPRSSRAPVLSYCSADGGTSNTSLYEEYMTTRGKEAVGIPVKAEELQTASHFESYIESREKTAELVADMTPEAKDEFVYQEFMARKKLRGFFSTAAAATASAAAAAEAASAAAAALLRQAQTASSASVALRGGGASATAAPAAPDVVKYEPSSSTTFSYPPPRVSNPSGRAPSPAVSSPPTPSPSHELSPYEEYMASRQKVEAFAAATTFEEKAKASLYEDYLATTGVAGEAEAREVKEAQASHFVEYASRTKGGSAGSAAAAAAAAREGSSQPARHSAKEAPQGESSSSSSAPRVTRWLSPLRKLLGKRSKRGVVTPEAAPRSVDDIIPKWSADVDYTVEEKVALFDEFLASREKVAAACAMVTPEEVAKVSAYEEYKASRARKEAALKHMAPEEKAESLFEEYLSPYDEHKASRK
ncbi:unnamed protein product [Scytosiphon promiscuus]